MNNYTLKARNKKTGEIMEFIKVYPDTYVFADSRLIIPTFRFNELYEVFENKKIKIDPKVFKDLKFDFKIDVSERIDYCCECDADHGYDCPKDTLEYRFNKEFVDEDTGLLNISKYDHERLLEFIKNETT